MTKNEFISKAVSIYGDKYTYEKCDNISYKEKITVTCKKHGDFKVRLDHFLSGHGCPVCAGRFLNTEFFIEKAREIHGNKYDYSKVKYENSQKKVCIICPEHGEFWQTPNSHLNGRGCPKCKSEKIHLRVNKGTEQFIEEAKKVHGDKYSYLNTNYINNRTKVSITCPIHGEFLQTPSHHLHGEGCPKCRYDMNSKNQMLTTEDFIKQAKQIHGDKYDYSKVIYNGYEEHVTIICPIHGEYSQSPDSHLHSGGCPKCGATLSKNEDDLISFIKEQVGSQSVIERDRKILEGKEIDILIPDKKIGIEYNGLYWYSEKNQRMNKFYHLQKTIQAKEKGISLIHIFEDEYVLHKEIVQHKILHLLKKDNAHKIMGRKCIIKEIQSKMAKSFLEKYHIQGFAKSTIYLGCFYKNELIGVMTFVKTKKEENKWELNRFASDYNYVCQGIGGKLFKYFIKNYNPEYVKSFADRRWCVDENNNLYTKLGFKIDSILNPDYKYYNEKVNKYDRIHKFNFRKQILHKKYGLPITITENKMAEELGYSKIWDCGLIKYVWKKN